MKPKDISRYTVLVEYTTGVAEFTEIFNDTGAVITPTEGSNTITLTADKDVWLQDRTMIIDSAKKTAGVQLTGNVDTTKIITCGYAQAGNDKFILEVRTFNITE